MKIIKDELFYIKKALIEKVNECTDFNRRNIVDIIEEVFDGRSLYVNPHDIAYYGKEEAKKRAEKKKEARDETN